MDGLQQLQFVTVLQMLWSLLLEPFYPISIHPPAHPSLTNMPPSARRCFCPPHASPAPSSRAYPALTIRQPRLAVLPAWPSSAPSALRSLKHLNPQRASRFLTRSYPVRTAALLSSPRTRLECVPSPLLPNFVAQRGDSPKKASVLDVQPERQTPMPRHRCVSTAPGGGVAADAATTTFGRLTLSIPFGDACLLRRGGAVAAAATTTFGRLTFSIPLGDACTTRRTVGKAPMHVGSVRRGLMHCKRETRAHFKVII